MKMRAVVVAGYGGVDQLSIGSVDKPAPGNRELLVRVHATAVNRADILQRQGKYPPPSGASDILGLEFSGIVEELGPQAIRRARGDRVCGILPGGGYAEYVVIHEDMTIAIPTSMSLTDAAAIPEAFLTAFQALSWHAQLVTGERILIHAAASGVGTALVQLARETGAQIYAVASEKKLELLRRMGADRAIAREDGRIADEVLTHSDGQGVQVIIDFVLGPTFEENLRVVGLDGRIVCLGSLGGSRVPVRGGEGVDLRAILSKRLRIIGSTLRNRGLTYQVELTRAFEKEVLPKLAGGWIVPVVDRVLDLEDVAEAHRYIESNESTGKVVLKVEK